MDVYFSPLAVTDLEEIRDHVAEHNVAAAGRLLDAIEETCERFGHHPADRQITRRPAARHSSLPREEELCRFLSRDGRRN